MKNWLIFGICCVILAACGGAASDPEAAVRAWVADAEAAAEEEDRGNLMGLISERYVDSRGNDHESIDKMLKLYFFKQDSIALLTGIDEISLMGDSAALVQLTVGMAGTNNSAFGISADAYQFEFELEVIDDDWMLIGARWGELGENMR